MLRRDCVNTTHVQQILWLCGLDCAERATALFRLRGMRPRDLQMFEVQGGFVVVKMTHHGLTAEVLKIKELERRQACSTKRSR